MPEACLENGDADSGLAENVSCAACEQRCWSLTGSLQWQSWDDRALTGC